MITPHLDPAMYSAGLARLTTPREAPNRQAAHHCSALSTSALPMLVRVPLSAYAPDSMKTPATLKTPRHAFC